MSVPEYVGRCNSTTFVGCPPFCYPGAPPREVGYHGTRYTGTAARKQEPPLPAPKSRDHGTKSVDTARDFFSSHKRNFHFVEHFCETPDVGRINIDGIWQDSNADTAMITSMIAGPDLSTGRSITCILNRTGLISLADKSPHGTLKALPPIPELMEDDDDDDEHGSFSRAGASPATPINGHPYLSTSMRCPYCCCYLECLFFDCNIDGKHHVRMHYADCTCKKIADVTRDPAIACASAVLLRQ
jgi:hypothetical protein